jgi:hypothetical protein
MSLSDTFKSILKLTLTSKDISQLKLIVEAVNLAVAEIDPSDINRKRGEVPFCYRGYEI